MWLDGVCRDLTCNRVLWLKLGHLTVIISLDYAIWDIPSRIAFRVAMIEQPVVWRFCRRLITHPGIPT